MKEVHCPPNMLMFVRLSQAVEALFVQNMYLSFLRGAFDNVTSVQVLFLSFGLLPGVGRLC